MALAPAADVQAWGEGGNGQNGTKGTHHSDGTGGGGGAYAEEPSLALTIGTTYPFTIGGGGTGTNTVFAGDSVTVTAAFGQGGASGGIGGVAGSNTIAFSGGTGTTHLTAGGAAGNTGNGGVPTGNDGGGNGGNGSGQAGSAPGGGGAGGLGTSTVADPGSAGAAGRIIITWTATVAGTAALGGAGTLTASGSVLSSYAGSKPPPQFGPGPVWLQRFGLFNAMADPSFSPPGTIHGTATLGGAGILTAFGSAPQPSAVNQWAANYGQGTTFTSITSALQSCVVPLTPAFSVGGGSGIPTQGNWLVTIASWTQDPQIANVHIGVGDDIHSWWREFPAAGSGGSVRTSISYTANTARTAGNVYVAPDAEIAAIDVLVVEFQGLGNWDTVVGTNTAYTPSGTSVSLSQAAGGSGTFFIGGVGGDNASSGQAFLPAGWLGLQAVSQSNGVNTLADNILTSAYLPLSNSTQNVSGSAGTAENLSGFLLAVLVSGNNPIPAGSNPNWPHVVFEAGFGSGFNTPDSEVTWTDISSRLWDWEETTGIQFQLGQLQSTQLTVYLDDVDGHLMPENTLSPYYPNVLPGTPLRIRAALGTMGGTTYNRWYIIQRNATQWEEAIDEVFRRYNPVSGTDLWAALSATPPSFYRSEIFEDNPYAWWPCNDQPGNSGVLPVTLLNTAIGNTNVLNILLSPLGGAAQDAFTTNGSDATRGGSSQVPPPAIASYTVGADPGFMFGDPQGPVPSLGTGNPVTATAGSAAWQALGQQGNTGSYGWFLSCNDSSFPALSGGITAECWFNYGFYGSATGYVAFGGGATHSVATQPVCPLTIMELATASAPVAVLQLDTSGHLNLITYNGGTGTSHSIYTASDLRSSSWHMVTLTATATSWTVWLDGGANAQVSGTAAGMTSAWTYLILNGDMGSSGGGSTGGLVHGGNVAIAHVAIYPCILPYYRIMDHYWAAVTSYGQLPAPGGVQLTWTPPVPPSQVTGGTATYFTADGSTAGGTYQASTGVAASAVVVATAPGVTSGPSPWATASAQYDSTNPAINTETLWISWTGFAPAFNLYTSATLGSETEAAVVNGAGDSFTSGFGAAASGHGVCQVAGGDGSSPPATASLIGDTVGQRIERLLRAGRFTSTNRCIDPAPLLVVAPGTAGEGTQVGAAVQALQQSDDGLLYVDNCNHLTYWQRPHLASQYGSPVWQIGPTTSAGRIPYYKEIRWVTDPQRVYNAISIAPLSPTGASLPLITPSNASAVNASQIAYGAQPLSVTSYLQSPTEMQNQANWLLSNFGTPQRHAENVKIDAAAYPQAWELVLGVNIGDIVQLEDWVIGGGGNVYTFRVTEMRRHISFGTPREVIAAVWLTLDFEPNEYWS
jgi:hypothetical protein